MLSGQPRFSASQTLITLPSVKFAPKEYVGCKLEWHTFSTHEMLQLMYNCTWREPSLAMMLSILHLSCCRHDYEGSGDFLSSSYQAICNATKLSLCHSQGHWLLWKVKFMQKSVLLPVRNFILWWFVCLTGREGQQETVIKPLLTPFFQLAMEVKSYF